MGYIIPTQPIQTGLYAGRSTLDPYNYANVQRVRPVKLKSLFEEELEEKLQEQNVPMEASVRKQFTERAGNPPVQHAALSPEISLVVGKGLQINTYA